MSRMQNQLEEQHTMHQVERSSISKFPFRVNPTIMLPTPNQIHKGKSKGQEKDQRQEDIVQQTTLADQHIMRNE